MAQQRVQRRLAAILAADVAGYSRLMGEDEEGTLSTLTAHFNELIEPAVTDPDGNQRPVSSPVLPLAQAPPPPPSRCCARFHGLVQRRE